MFCLVFRCLANHNGFILSLPIISRHNVHSEQDTSLTIADVNMYFKQSSKILIFFTNFMSDPIRLLAILQDKNNGKELVLGVREVSNLPLSSSLPMLALLVVFSMHCLFAGTFFESLVHFVRVKIVKTR